VPWRSSALGQPRFLVLEGDARRLSGPIPPEADGNGAAACLKSPASGSG
jgi:hypothetical protein